jgi:hypothetical protein
MPGMTGGMGAPGGMYGGPRPPGMPMSQPPPAPVAQKMYVRTTPIETAATLAATTHISFLWTMMAIAGGAGLALSCMGIRNARKKKKKDADKEKEEESSSDSESE